MKTVFIVPRAHILRPGRFGVSFRRVRPAPAALYDPSAVFGAPRRPAPAAHDEDTVVCATPIW